jgi:hypothetical protein
MQLAFGILGLSLLAFLEDEVSPAHLGWQVCSRAWLPDVHISSSATVVTSILGAEKRALQKGLKRAVV